MTEYGYVEGFVPFARDIIAFNIEKAVQETDLPEIDAEPSKDVTYILNTAICSINAMNKMCAMLFMQCMRKMGVTYETLDVNTLCEKKEEDIST